MRFLFAQATSVQLDDLQPNTSYQVNVRPVNSVGDGPASDTLVVETQPGAHCDIKIVACIALVCFRLNAYVTLLDYILMLSAKVF